MRGAVYELRLNHPINDIPEWSEKIRQVEIALKRALAINGFVPDSGNLDLSPTESENAEVLNMRYLLDVYTTYTYWWAHVPCDRAKKIE